MVNVTNQQLCNCKCIVKVLPNQTTFVLSLVVEPASNLQVLEISSKSMRVTWDPSLGEITGYKLTLMPMMAGMKRQVVYVGPTQTSVNVRDLSPETEYEISLFALKGLTPSDAVLAMEKTQPVKVSLGEIKLCNSISAIQSLTHSLTETLHCCYKNF